MFRLFRLWRGLSALGVIESLLITTIVSRRMIWFRSGSCLSKLERVKAGSIELIKIAVKTVFPQCNLNY